MDRISECVLDAIEEISGIEKEDLLGQMEVNLIQEEILDSISITALIMYLEENLKINIDFNTISFKDFETIESIINALKNKYNHN